MKILAHTMDLPLLKQKRLDFEQLYKFFAGSHPCWIAAHSVISTMRIIYRCLSTRKIKGLSFRHILHKNPVQLSIIFAFLPVHFSPAKWYAVYNFFNQEEHALWPPPAAAFIATFSALPTLEVRLAVVWPKMWACNLGFAETIRTWWPAARPAAGFFVPFYFRRTPLW